MDKKYSLDKVFYATLNDGEVETFIQHNDYSVDNRTIGKRVYMDEDSRDNAYRCIRSYYKDGETECVQICKLTDYIKSFFEAKDLVFSKSHLLHKRYGAVVKARASALKDNWLYQDYFEDSKYFHLELNIAKILQEYKVTEEEAKYIGQKIQEIQKQREESDRGIYIV